MIHVIFFIQIRQNIKKVRKSSLPSPLRKNKLPPIRPNFKKYGKTSNKKTQFECFSYSFHFKVTVFAHVKLQKFQMTIEEET